MTTGQIATFFFLAFLDEEKAIQATRKIVTKRKLRLFAKENIAKIERSIWNQCQREIKTIVNPRLKTPNPIHFELPKGFDLERWARFRSVADNKELTAVVGYWVLQIPIERWQEITHESVGAYRYRLSRAMQKWIQFE